MWNFRAAAVQLTSTEDVADNLAAVRSAVTNCAAAGATLVVLPECFAFLGASEQAKLAITEDLNAPGPILNTLRELATKHAVTIVGGGMAERNPSDPLRPYNTSVVVTADGWHATYRKIHLFDVDIPGGAQLCESAATTPGTSLSLYQAQGCTIGQSICYDLRFPELFRRLTQDGAELITVPAAFTAHTGQAHWHVLLRARAIENQVWIVAAAQVGVHNPKRKTYGHSMIIDPWGNVVAECTADEPGFAVAELSHRALAERRAQMPCLQHAVLLHDRRP